MLRKTRTWDVRCPAALARLYPRSMRRGYYYKVTREEAQEICRLLSKEYGVPTPRVMPTAPTHGCNGQALPGKIWVHGRAHMKSVFHEWYHTLEWATDGRYDSSDRKGGPSSLAWQFADQMFDALRNS